MSEPRKPSPAGRSTQRKGRTSPPKEEHPPVVEEDAAPAAAEEGLPSLRAEGGAPEAEGYTLQCFYDPREDVFRVTFVEFPEIKTSDSIRAQAVEMAEEKLHSQLAALRQAGQAVPQPIQTREYPSRLDIPISQTLSKKLETLRNHERVSIEQLVTEILTSVIERKGGAEPAPRHQEKDRGRGAGPRNQGRQHGGGGNRQGGGERGGHRGGGRNSYDALQNRENFMEYVRNLEKGGGYKKR